MDDSDYTGAAEDEGMQTKVSRVRRLRLPGPATKEMEWEAESPLSYPISRDRPISVTIIAILNFIGAAFSVIQWLQTLGIDRSLIDDEFASSSLKVAYNINLFGLPIAIILTIAIGVGLWRLKNWARITAIVFYWLGVGLTLLGMAVSRTVNWTSFITVVVGVTFAILLSQRNVAEAFQ